MDTSRDKPTGKDGNPYIWLRYKTQFNAGGRTHTIEMGIPMPLGASAEMREQLIREAEIGMEQLTRRVENRVAQISQRSTRPPEPLRTQAPATIRSNQAPLQEEGYRSSTGTPPPVGTRSTTQAPVPAREIPQPLSLHEKQSTTVPVRQSGPVNMPVTPGMQSEANSNMKLSQFMQAIRDAWGLTPKQAMDLLNVKTLNGMNYREALRQLQPLVEGDARSVSTSDASTHSPIVNQPKPAEERVRPQGPPPSPTLGEERVRPQGSPPNPTPPTPVRKEAKQDTLAGPANIPVIPIKDDMIREVPRKAYKFDEEDEEMEEEE